MPEKRSTRGTLEVSIRAIVPIVFETNGSRQESIQNGTFNYRTSFSQSHFDLEEQTIRIQRIGYQGYHRVPARRLL